MKIQSVLIFTLFLFIQFLPINSYSQWSTTPDSNLQVSTFGQFPEACSDNKGGVYIAFESFDYEHSHVYVQYVDRYGYIQWNPAIDLGDRGGLEGEHRVVADGNGSVIVYYDLLTPIDTIEWDIIYKSEAVLQKLDSLGNRLWGPDGIKASLDTSDQRIMDVVTDGAGGAIMMWKDFYGIFPDTIRLNTQRISSGGQRMWGDSGIVINNNIGGSTAKIISDANGGAIITYGGITYKRIDSTGNNIWTSSAFYGYLSLESDNKGGAILAGKKNNSSYYNLTANYLLADGNFLWDSLGIIIEDSVEIESRIGDLKLFNDSLIIVFWTNINSTRTIVTAYVQYLKLNGDILFPNKSLPVSKISSKNGANDIIESGDEFIFIFSDGRNNRELYAQKFDTSGNTIWDTTDILITDKNLDSPSAISDLNDGAIIVFDDAPLYGIFAQQVSKNGILGEILTGINRNKDIRIPENYKLYQNYPNPFNNNTNIKYYLSKKSEITLNIYSILGEKIRSFSRNHVSEGNYSVVWDGKSYNGKDVSSGIYLYQMETENFTQTKKLIYLK